MNQQYFKNRNEWREWLEANHTSETEVWIVYYKKHTKKESITYDEGVEEALCFGWIDSLVKRIDDERYMQKYTPRKNSSTWSLLNKNRIEKLIEEGKMTPAGLEKVEAAKKSGWWDKAYTSRKQQVLPNDLKEALQASPKAWDNFRLFSNSAQTMYISWLHSAKREDTRQRRIKTIVERSEQNKKPGFD